MCDACEQQQSLKSLIDICELPEAVIKNGESKWDMLVEVSTDMPRGMLGVVTMCVFGLSVSNPFHQRGLLLLFGDPEKLPFKVQPESSQASPSSLHLFGWYLATTVDDNLTLLQSIERRTGKVLDRTYLRSWLLMHLSRINPHNQEYYPLNVFQLAKLSRELR